MTDVSLTAGARRFSSGQAWRRAIAWGLLLTLLQLLWVYLLSGTWNPSSAYDRLYQWDSGWYASIMDQGYISSIPPTPQNASVSNVAFFPGYPGLSWLLGRVLGLPTRAALLVTAQLACWGFWTYFLRLLSRWEVPRGGAIAAVLAVFVYPTAFFLVAGYSESLFLMTLLGLIYWGDGSGAKAFWAAAGHGFLMSATRIVGLPLALYAVLQVWERSPTPSLRVFAWGDRRFRRSLLIAACTALGGLSFFAFCQGRFGVWNLYMETQQIGWNIQPDYGALLNSMVYQLFWPTLDSDTLSRFSVPVVVYLLGAVVAWEGWIARRHAPSLWHQRLGLYFCAGAMLYISICGLIHRDLISMSRYNFCVYVILVLAVAKLGAQVPQALPGKGRFSQVGWEMVVRAIATFSLVIQALLLQRFLQGDWVA